LPRQPGGAKVEATVRHQHHHDKNQLQNPAVDLTGGRPIQNCETVIPQHRRSVPVSTSRHHHSPITEGATEPVSRARASVAPVEWGHSHWLSWIARTHKSPASATGNKRSHGASTAWTAQSASNNN
jgi:hypothetical protein